MRPTRFAKAIQALEDLALRPEHDEIARRAMSVLTTKPVPSDHEWQIACAIAAALKIHRPTTLEVRRRVIEAVLDAVEDRR